MRRRTYIAPAQRREHIAAALGAVTGMLAMTLVAVSAVIVW